MREALRFVMMTIAEIVKLFSSDYCEKRRELKETSKYDNSYTMQT